MDVLYSGVSPDLDTFNHFFKTYQQRYIRFAVTYVSDVAVAEDIVMESFVAAWEKRATLTVEALPPYTLTIVKNRCLNWLRAKMIRSKAAEDIHSHGMRILQTRISTLEACDPEELFNDEAIRIMHATLDKMPARTRDIFMRSRFRGQSYKEIAAELHSTPKSVEFEISKAMKSLRIALKDYLPFFVFWLTLK